MISYTGQNLNVDLRQSFPSEWCHAKIIRFKYAISWHRAVEVAGSELIFRCRSRLRFKRLQSKVNLLCSGFTFGKSSGLSS